MVGAVSSVSTLQSAPASPHCSCQCRLHFQARSRPTLLFAGREQFLRGGAVWWVLAGSTRQWGGGRAWDQVSWLWWRCVLDSSCHGQPSYMVCLSIHKNPTRTHTHVCCTVLGCPAYSVVGACCVPHLLQCVAGAGWW